MKSIVADIHTHTLVSGHAYGTIREMAQAAAERGLEAIGFSEHAPGIPGTCDPIYYVNLRVVPRTLYGVKVLFGSEINVLNDGSLSLEQRYIEKLDYAIVGIHGLCYDNQGANLNTAHLISCMRHEKVSFVSHPDDDHTPLDYETLVPAAKEHHVALEVNNSSFLKQQIRLHCVENYRKMLALCSRHRVPILIGSDAHDPSDVGRCAEALALLKEVDFDEALVLNNDLQKLFAFIGYTEKEKD